MRDDYLLSNETRADEVDLRIEELKKMALDADMTAEERAHNGQAIEAFYLLEPAYIDATRNEAEERFGGVMQYIEDGLSKTEEELEVLR